jgi:hypothetical protein
MDGVASTIIMYERGVRRDQYHTFTCSTQKSVMVKQNAVENVCTAWMSTSDVSIDVLPNFF